MQSEPTFKVGDIVRLKGGSAPMEVLAHRHVTRNLARTGFMIQTRYCRSFPYSENYNNRWRSEFDFVTYVDDPATHDYSTKKAGKTIMAKLYQTLETTPRFGTLLAKNSAGQLVLEMKGTTQVEAFDPDALEEVKPYTVAVAMSNTHVEHFEAPKDKLQAGDTLLFKSGSIGVVRALNTSSTAAPKLEARRIVTEEI